jgi:hypothetical protein
MNTNMDKNQAQQLKKHIQHEAPHLNVKENLVDFVGSKTGPEVWAVYIYDEGLPEPIPIETQSAWEAVKNAFRLPPS